MYYRVGLTCLGLALLLWAVSLPLHCANLAIGVATANFMAGGLFGLFLALVTRTRTPWQIYLFLGLACLTLWPLYRNWPPADYGDLVVPQGAPSILENYFTLLRLSVFLLGLPFPFAALGQHGPDPLPANTAELTAITDLNKTISKEIDKEIPDQNEETRT